jgi:hypothetical protein
MTVTGTVGGLCFLAWAGLDGVWVAHRRRVRQAQPVRATA